MRQIQESGIRFVGEEVQFHGAALRRLKRLARQLSREKGYTVSATQIANDWIAGVRKGIDIHADLVRAMDKIRQILDKLKGGNIDD